MEDEQAASDQEIGRPIAEIISVALMAAFNAGYDVGRSDGTKYRVEDGADTPDRATRRREWIGRLAP